MEYSSASITERQKVQLLTNFFSKKVVEHPAQLELYNNNEVIAAELVKRLDRGFIKYFLVSPTQTVKASYLESLWEKELYKWSWGSKELNINP